MASDKDETVRCVGMDATCFDEMLRLLCPALKKLLWNRFLSGCCMTASTPCQAGGGRDKTRTTAGGGKKDDSSSPEEKSAS